MTQAVSDEAARLVWKIFMTDGRKSLGDIAELVGKSRTAVFNIVRRKEKEDPDFPLMRALIVNLHKDGTDLIKYANIIRIFNILNQYGVDYIMAEDMIKSFLLTCSLENWEASEVMKTMNAFLRSAERYGKSPKQHADYFRKLYIMESELREKMEAEKKALRKLIDSEAIIKDNLKVFMSHDGVAKWITNRRLAESSYPDDILALKKDLALCREGKSVDPSELEKLNKHLPTPVSERDVLDKLDDIRRNPSEYKDLFENWVREIFSLQVDAAESQSDEKDR